jgi:hypothetical protein
LAEQKGAMLWRVLEKCARGWLLTMTGNPSDAVQMLTTSIAALRSTGATTWTLFFLPWPTPLHVWMRSMQKLQRPQGIDIERG